MCFFYFLQVMKVSVNLMCYIYTKILIIMLSKGCFYISGFLYVIHSANTT